jgi:Zn-dependent protease with chaperone function
MNWAVRRYGDRWGFHELHDIASLPLLTLTLSIVSLIVQPATNTFTRMIEHEADVFGVEVTRLNDAAARAFIKLGSQNKSDPEPPLLIKFFQYTHPPLIERIRFAMSYKPWEEGKPNRAFTPKEANANQ